MKHTKKILMSLCAVGLMSTAAFASSATEVNKDSAKSRRVLCNYQLNFYDSHGNYLTTESSFATFESGGCSAFFKAMRKYYTSLGHQIHNVG